jgi:hypothetical protein
MVEVKIEDPIYIKNFDAIMKKMEEMDKKLAKKFKRELRQAVKPVQTKAQSFVPTQPFPGWRDVNPTYPPVWGWANDTEHRGRTIGKNNVSRWKWSQDEVKKGIVISRAPTTVQRQGFNITTSALSIQSKSIAGIIYELAGFGKAASKARTRKVSRNKNASQEFIAKLNRTRPASRPRLLYEAAHQLSSQVHDNLYKVLKNYLKDEFKD